MKRTLRRVRNGTAALALAAALGFGVTQALAEPREAARRECTPAMDAYCHAYCVSIGGISGRCINDLCACRFPIGGGTGGG